MPICSECHLDKERSAFTKKQLSKISSIRRRCYKCVEAVQTVEKKTNQKRKDETNAKKAADNLYKQNGLTMAEEAVCYLCLDGDLDDDGQPLRRDCACRGTDAGFVHLSCLTGYAAAKSEHTNRMTEFINPWERCPSCDQYYQNDFAVDIATEFISFVRRQYPQDTRRQVEALNLKLNALGSMLKRLQPEQKREVGVIANVLLSLIDRMKGDTLSPLPRRYYHMEAVAYNVHGSIALYEGMEESVRRAVAYFEKSLQMFEAIDDDEGIVTAKSNIATAKGNIAITKSKYKGGNNNEEVLKASHELYELRIAEYGGEHENTIRAGTNYAIDLQKANRREEARELLLKLLATSKQVFGSDHNITKRVESML
jgi:hypothetical protein